MRLLLSAVLLLSMSALSLIEIYALPSQSLPRAEDVLPREEVSKGSLVVAGDDFRFQISPDFKPVQHPSKIAYRGTIKGLLEPGELTLYATRQPFSGTLEDLLKRETDRITSQGGMVSRSSPAQIQVAGKMSPSHRFTGTLGGKLDFHMLAVHKGSAYIFHAETPDKPTAWANLGSEIFIRAATFHPAPVLPGQAAPSTIAQTPFGFQIGQPKKTMSNIAEEVGPHRYLLASVPKPDPALEIYSVVVTPVAGLCSVRAMSPDLKTAPAGTELKSLFDKMASQVERTYGKPDILMALAPESNLTKPDDWMAALLKKDRAVIALWPTSKLAPESTLSRVTVAAVALSANSGYIAVQYYFTNYDQCQREITPTQR